MQVEDINPYSRDGEKGDQVEQMFDSIAPAYDFMNTAMTLGLHRRWRNKALKAAIAELTPLSDSKVLDVATGTGDVAFRIAGLLPGAIVTGIDISEGMLEIARKKMTKLPTEIQKKMAFGKADSMLLPFQDNEFDLVTVAYGVRNFSNLLKGLKEIRRVIRQNGILCIIELSCPEGKFTSPAYKFYSQKIIPFMGRLVSKDTRAYTYLPESIAACPQRENMAALLYEAGFNTVQWTELTFGAVTYYIAK